VLRRRPTPDESRDFKSRVRYLVDATGKGPGFWEANSGGRLARGEVQRWLTNPMRGKNPGVLKVQKAAEAFNVHWEWLLTGQPVRGAIFLDDPIEEPVERRLAQLEQLVRERLPMTKHVADESEPPSDRRPSSLPAKLAKTGARKRPG
jgi:transcriptional regulator with XRE-family HTH domain